VKAIMTPERFRQVRNLFEAALEKAPDARDAFIAEASEADAELQAEVQRMVAAHARKVTFLDGTLTAPIELRTDPLRMEGRRLGHWEILTEIGRGGMGTVYLARRADGVYEQRVALKVVTPASGSEEVVRRFAQERSILATLEHPNIARIYDGGATAEGWPYFVMEYVHGKPIDAWCDERRLNTSERIRLFRTVCTAIQHAHLHGVVHRDLKPGNILVTEDGTVKLLDFGIAKVVHTDAADRTAIATRTGTRLMTPEYASPEQLLADETTPLTDVYSLGVILYELLTGRKPYKLKSRILHEMVRAVCEEPARRASATVTDTYEEITRAGTTQTIAPGFLSSSREGTPVDLKRRLSGDLDGILSKVLEKKPEDRYRSVEQFSSDLERHLEGKPVLAARAGRFAAVTHALSQHKVAFVSVLVVLLAFITGAVRVEQSNIVYFGGAMLLVAMVAAVLHKRIGAWLRDPLNRVGILSMIGVVLLIMVLRVWTGSFEAADKSWDFIMARILPALVVILCGGFVRWVIRPGWAGELLAGFATVRKTKLLITLMLLNTYDVIYVAVKAQKFELSGWFFLVLALCLIHARWIERRVEVRERGILYRGSLIPWLRMVNYQWMEGETQPRGLLRLNVRRPLPFLIPHYEIVVPDADVKRVDECLRRNISPVVAPRIEEAPACE